MDEIWTKLYDAAKKVVKDWKINEHIDVGGVAAAILTSSNNIYVGSCVETSASLGVCAERNAIFNMLTNGEHKIKKVLSIDSDGKAMLSCGACRELMVQLDPDNYKDIEMMVDYEKGEIVTLGELLPKWWM